MSEAAPRTDFAASALEDETCRPLVMGRRGLVSAGHHLASVAGHHVFERDGTAIDAGIAAGVALDVLVFDRVNFAGVAPTILHHAASRQVVTIDGLGVWPQAASASWFRDPYGPELPRGILRTVTPAAPDAWLTALARFGTLTVGDVFEPAWELAAKGAPVSTGVAASLAAGAERLGELAPTTIDAFFPGGRPLRAGELFARPELARVLKAMMDEEAAARRRGLPREDAIRAARDLFYKGWIAEEICRFQEAEGGLLRLDDLTRYSVEVEPPLTRRYRGYDVHTCGFWCQGPVLLQALGILANFELAEEPHNGASYLHLVLESLDLAFADRESFYGDPRFVEVPAEGLLSTSYGAERAGEIEPGRTRGRMPDPGNAWRHQGDGRPVRAVDVDRYRVPAATPARDTSYVSAVDADGNVFSATPSDPVLEVPVVPSLGFSCSGRGYQSRVDPGHPSIEPGKRPRLTPNPALVTVGSRPLLAFGCPGGDAQTQAMLQVLLNMVDFGMTPQQAIEAPRAISWNFPNSFAPHDYYPGRVEVEGRILEDVVDELRDSGRDAVTVEPWSGNVARVYVAAIEIPVDGVLVGGSDPREEGGAVGW